MKTRLIGGAASLLVLVGACADNIPVQPSTGSLRSVSATASAKAASPALDEQGEVSPALAAMNAQLATAGSNVRIAKAELLLDGSRWDGATSQVIFANDRSRGIGSEWVPGDPRRDGRVGVTYAFGSNTGVAPFVRDADGGNVHNATPAEINTQIEEAVDAWRGRSCSNAAITRVNPQPGTDPDQLDQFYRGLPPSPNYVPPADIVQAGWQPVQFFRAVAGPNGGGIIGLTFTFVYVDTKGTPSPLDDVHTDIDGDGNDDTGLVEIFYSANFWWGNQGAPNAIDFYSIITHETGHGLGLAHFGKIFVTKKDVADAPRDANGNAIIPLEDIKFAPLALMNAIYFGGRSEIRGTDNSSFCQIWASK